jgi:hypothetical protein
MCSETNPTVNDMKEETAAAVIKITPDTLGRVGANFQHQLQMIMDDKWFTYYMFSTERLFSSSLPC